MVRSHIFFIRTELAEMRLWKRALAFRADKKDKHHEKSRASLRRLFPGISVTSGIIALSFFLSCAGPKPSGQNPGEAPSTWQLWYSLQLPFELVRDQVHPRSRRSLNKVAQSLGAGQYRRAYQQIEALAQKRPEDRFWLHTLGANLASMRLDRCIRGRHWRLPDSADKPPRARLDWDPKTTVQAGDIELQGLLQALDEAAQQPSRPLQIQAEIARARVLAWTRECPATPGVAELSHDKLRQDCRSLAHKKALPPDLSYVFAMILLEDGTPALARPHLERALKQGYRDPAVDYLLAGVLYELKSFAEARVSALKAARDFALQNNRSGQADAWCLAGQAAIAGDKIKKARLYLEKARAIDPLHPRALATELHLRARENRRYQSANWLAQTLAPLWPAFARRRVDDPQQRAAIDKFNELAWTSSQLGPLEVEILQLALTLHLDDEPDPYLRGFRYFWAATLDFQLGEHDQARGRAALAAQEFASIPIAAPLPIPEFLSQLHQASPATWE